MALLPAVASGQAFVITNGSDDTCVGAFLDSGGQGATGYSNNENYTYTLCPDNPGDAISVDFLTFQLSTAGAAPIDNLVIHDGNSTAAPVIGTYTGTSLQGQIVSAGPGNSSGCLTFVWTSNATGTGIFAGTISCYVPCTRPVAAATMGQGPPALICQGESVTFNGSASTAAPGFSIASYTWTWDDGTITTSTTPTASHTFNAPGEYLVQLVVTDNNGCASVNLLNLQVLVGTPPTFTGTSADPAACVGTPICMDGVVNATTWSAQPSANFGNGVALPDDVGSCFTSQLLFDGFAPGATLTNINQLPSICIDIEHSFLGDLIISIISPSGETVVLHQQGGTGTYLGVPVDNELTPNAIGTCWTYCFSPTATNGTMAANAGATLPAGTYESVDPLSGLLGSQLNGLWTIEICDLWALDNGFLCGWELDFDPSLFPGLTQFTPVYGNACDSTWWTGPNIVSNTGDCEEICVQPPAPGSYAYVYHAIDNFGCTYDTTITITVSPPPVANAGPDLVICAGQGPVQLNATASGGAPVTDCTYSLQMLDSFGDGWNGASVTITINGVPTTYTLNNGSSGTINLPVQTGDAISVSFAPGAYDGEITYRIRNGSNTILFSDGPFPTIGQAWSGVVYCGTVPITYSYSWSPATGLNNPNIANPTANPGSTTTYTVTVTQNGQPGCTDTDQVTVTVTTPIGAGTDGSITVCSTAPAFDLYGQLTGATPGGTWTAPGGVSTTSTFTPGTSVPGVYTYTVNSAAPCPGTDQSTVTVTVVNPPNAGTSSSVSVCSTAAPVSLSAQLGGSPDAGGTWSGPSPVVGEQFNPANMSAGVYTYTVPGTAPCPPASSTVTVSIVPPPNAGTNGTLTICGDVAATSLFALLGGSPQAGGTWSGPSPVVGGMFDPATMAAGAYTYTVAGTMPCPDATATVNVTVVPPPDAGTNGNLTVCSTAPPSSLFSQLGGTPDAGGLWTGPSPVTSGLFDPATMLAGVYTYTVAGTAPCTSTSATVTVTLSSLPNAGTPGATTLCADAAALPLFPLLGGSPQAGGTWTGPSTVTGGQFDPATMTPGVYTYTVGGNPPCPSASTTVTIAVEQPVDAGSDGSITLCSTDAAVSLFGLLGGAPDAGGAWSGPSAVSGGMFDPASMSAGAYTYTVTGIAPCPTETATVTVTVNVPPDPGTPGSTTRCSTDAAMSLFGLLGGTPDAGGTWSGPSAVSGGMFDPASMSAGVYTYTVTGATPCPTASTTVTVGVNMPVDAGSDGSMTLCSTDAAVSLFGLLGGTPDAGGTWSGPSAVSGGMFDPASMSAGVYIYTVTSTAPCPNENATVTVSVNTPPDAGTPGSTTLCSTDAAVDLFGLLGGTPDAGGTWSGPSTVNGGMFDPASMSTGVYTYTVTGAAPCPMETATITLSVNTPPDPGTPGTITLCATDAPADLFVQLGGTPDAGGNWSGPSAVSGGLFDPASMSAGVYTYTVTGTAPCPNETATVTVSVNTPPDAGLDGGLTLCSSSPTVALSTGLNGTPDPGGVWTAPGGGVSNGTFQPGTGIPGVYTYVVTGTAPCPNASATVNVAVSSNPDAGTPGAITLCTTDTPTLLFNALGGTPDLGGSWSGPSAVIGGLFDPAMMSAGVYTYTITVPPPCTSASSTVTVALSAPPDPGLDGALTLCATSPATDLITGLGGTPDPGGSWSGPNAVAGGQFDPATMIPGVYTYTVNGTAPCPAASANVTVSVVTNPEPGTPGAITLCTTDAPADLFAQLGGTPDTGGTWSGPSALNGSSFDPATMSAGVYTYTITVPPPCTSASSTVTVALSAPPDPGLDGALTLCATSPATDLITGLGGTPDPGESWSGPSAVAGGQFDPATMIPGVYTYTVNGTAPCPAASANVTVSVVTNPDPGTPGAITLCTTDAPADLFAQLGGTPDAGGTWTGPSALNGSSFDPATMSAGVYSYTINVPPPCTNASSTVTVTLNTPPDPGADATVTLCVSSPTTDLYAALGGTPDAGGSWSGPNPVLGGQFDPATMTPGVYTYTVNGTAPCPDASATVTVNVITLPDPGTPAAITACITDAPIDLFAQLGGTPDAGGTWSGPSAVSGGLFDPASMSNGVYTYTINVPPPCVSVSSTVTVDVVAPPNAGTNGTLTLCATSSASPLFNALGGAPDPGGSWTDPNGNAHSGTFDPATDVTGTYTYTVTGQSPCTNASASATVTVQPQPNAGQPATLNFCISGAPVDLFPVLGGADPNGSWTGPLGVFGGLFTPGTDPAGAYTYTVPGTFPCPAASATITVNVLSNPNAGLDAALTLCNTGSSIDLFAQLGGTPDPGGAWVDPNGASTTASFDPASAAPGTYTYLLLVPAPCVNDTAQVTMGVVIAPDAGADGGTTLCVNDPPMPLFGLLGGSPDPGGTWTSPSNQPWTGPFDPMTDTAGTYTYTVTGTAPCPNDAALVTMTVEPMPDAGSDGAITVCPDAQPVTLFTLLGGTPDAGGSWTDPNGQPSNGVFDPATSPQGSYTYTVYSFGGCPNVSASATVSIYVIDPPDAGPDLVVCDLDATLAATGNWSTGQWSSPSGTQIADTSASSTVVSAAIGGLYTFTWSITTPDGCAASDSVTITFTTPLLPSSVTSDAICAGSCNGSAEVTVTGGNGPFAFQWSPAVTSTLSTTGCTAAGLCAGTYTVTVLDTNGCSAQAMLVIDEPPPLVIDNITALPETCPGTCDGSLVVTDPQGALYSFDGGATWQQVPLATGLCSGPYTVLMMDATGCVATSPAALIPPAPVIAEFVPQPDTVLVSDPEVIFTNESENASWFTWDFAGLGSSNLHDPSFTFPGVLGGTYMVCLTAINGNDCVDTVCHPVVVLDLLTVHVPNAFTPDGDGINDLWMPLFNEPQLLIEYELLVFDRWGELLWESHTPHQPWDGIYRGEMVKEEVYVWKLNYKDGRSYKKEAVIGHVTVLK